MRPLPWFVAAFALLPGSLVAVCGDDRPPNFVIILADDLGFSDLGCYGGEIETPHLDGLAAGGLRFTQFYNTARCWPTRAAVMTGYYPQAVGRDEVQGSPRQGKGTRPPWAPLLPVMLRERGYQSYHSGKWHIDGQPVAQGFDHSYLLVDQGRFFSPQRHFLDDRPLPAVERDSGYYATQAIAARAIAMLQRHSAEHADAPFCLYLAFTAPHFPLQALPEDIAKYRDRYRRGWEEVRAERWERVRKLGIVDGSLSDVERDVGPPYDFPDAFEVLGPGEVNRPLPWRELTETQRAFQTEKMAIHAAMIDCMDREIGRVLQQIRSMGAWEDTWTCFLSDNGASAEIMVRGDGHDPQAPPGSAATHLCLGPGWSTVCNTPFRRHKTWVHEGGTATPLIVHWPRGIAARGELRRTPGHAIDLVPTLRELAGLDPDAVDDGAPPRHGRSLAAVFPTDAPVRGGPLWFRHEGNRALRHGDWKLVAARDEPWELYNLAEDRCETTDLAGRHPDRVVELAAQWEQQWEELTQLANRP